MSAADAVNVWAAEVRKLGDALRAMTKTLESLTRLFPTKGDHK